MVATIMEKTIIITGRGVCLSKVVLLFCLPILFFSCNTKEVYHTFNHIPVRGWDKRVIERFSPLIEDTVSLYDIDLSLRYTNDYNYRNLWLFITCEAETGEEFTDTLNCVLADEYGKWFGAGWGASYQQTISYKTGFSFPRKGRYSISVQQGMRDDVIPGITEVGIKITPKISITGE